MSVDQSLFLITSVLCNELQSAYGSARPYWTCATGDSRHHSPQLKNASKKLPKSWSTGPETNETGGVFELDPGQSIPEGITRVLDEVFDEAESRLDAMSSPNPGDVEHAVHQFRKRCKELRAVARLVRPALGPGFGGFNHLVRDASAQFSASRDAHVMAETIDSLAPGTGLSPDLSVIRDRQVAIAAAATMALQQGDERVDVARRLFATARDEANEWDLPGCTAPIAEGLERSYRRGRHAFRAAKRKPTDERMHEWRKSAKNLWHHAQLLVAADREAMAALVNDLDSLGDLIGEDHDLAVFIETVGDTEEGRAACELARKRQDKVRRTALRLGKQIYRERPDELVERIMAGWARAENAAQPSTT